MSAAAKSAMPVWLNDNTLDPAWLGSKLTFLDWTDEVVTTVQDISNLGRRGKLVRNGSTLLVTIDPTGKKMGTSVKSSSTFVLKQQQPTALSVQLGLAREALFYAGLSATLQGNTNLPQIHYSYGDMTTGEKCILMEHVKGADSGILFGPGNPNNWSRDLPVLTRTAFPDSVPTVSDVTKATFVATARIHATFWKDLSLLDQSDRLSKDWLRGSGWIQGRGKETWVASQALIQGIWNNVPNPSRKNGEEADASVKTILWDPRVYTLTSHAMASISWDVQCERLHASNTKEDNKGSKNCHWTLVHGDFWPGNIMVSSSDSNGTDASLKTTLLDWEMVGLGSGPQELGQYMLSNMEPSVRRSCEIDLVRAYHDELIRCGVATDQDGKDTTLWHYCWHEYKVGGVERWLWFLVYFLGQEAMVDWAQFFHDQIAAFVKDHDLTENDIGQPRP